MGGSGLLLLTSLKLKKANEFEFELGPAERLVQINIRTQGGKSEKHGIFRGSPHPKMLTAVGFWLGEQTNIESKSSYWDILQVSFPSLLFQLSHDFFDSFCLCCIDNKCCVAGVDDNHVSKSKCCDQMIVCCSNDAALRINATKCPVNSVSVRVTAIQAWK